MSNLWQEMLYLHVTGSRTLARGSHFQKIRSLIGSISGLPSGVVVNITSWL